MRLLFDQNLSRLLVRQLASEFPESIHVTAVGLGTATDRQVWDFAHANDFIIVSKDTDFSQLAFLHGAPPKVIWLRVGNAPTTAIQAVLAEHAPAIAQFVNDDEDAVLIIPSIGTKSSTPR